MNEPKSDNPTTSLDKGQILRAIVSEVEKAGEGLKRRHYNGKNSCHCQLNDAHYRTSSGHYEDCYTWQAANAIYSRIFGGGR